MFSGRLPRAVGAATAGGRNFGGRRNLMTPHGGSGAAGLQLWGEPVLGWKLGQVTLDPNIVLSGTRRVTSTCLIVSVEPESSPGLRQEGLSTPSLRGIQADPWLSGQITVLGEG